MAKKNKVVFTEEEYKGRQCLCANNNLHDGQCQNIAKSVCGAEVEGTAIIIYLCDDCFGAHVPVDEYEDIEFVVKNKGDDNGPCEQCGPPTHTKSYHTEEEN